MLVLIWYIVLASLFCKLYDSSSVFFMHFLAVLNKMLLNIMWIPLELINYIFYLADNARFVYYHEKRNEFVVKIDINHNNLKKIRTFYDKLKVYTICIPSNCSYPFTRETQFCFPMLIEGRYEDIESYEHIKSYEHVKSNEAISNTMLIIIDQCNTPKSEENVIFNWNRFFVMNSVGGRLLNIL